MSRILRLAPFLSLALLGLSRPALASPAAVRAVLFYSPSCPHCQIVIREKLPSILDRYGNDLEIAAVDTQTTQGQKLYQAAVGRLDIPSERWGVPTLIVGRTVLVGSAEIPQQLPSLIDEGLAAGGIGWPDIPGLAEALPSLPREREVEAALGGRLDGGGASPPTATVPQAAAPGLAGLQRDPIGSGLAVVVALATAVSLVVIPVRLRTRRRALPRASRGWETPALAMAGLLIAGYLTYVEVTGTPAVCGPVGDCNAVQSSPYATLFGIVPVALVGLAGYFAILVAWLAAGAGLGPASALAKRLASLMAVVGALVSLALTLVEPIAIGAVCAWCLASAVVMTGLLWTTAEGARSPAPAAATER
jgi:uncharacterized membrane protein